MSCRLCGSDNLTKSVSLGPTYIADTFLPEPYSKPLKYNYDIWVCLSCHHVQSFDVIEPDILFGSSYTYKPGYSASLRSGFQSYVDYLIDKGYLSTDTVLLDLGSNDGLFLDCARNTLTCKVYGIEPAKAPREFALSQGIPTLPYFFNLEAASQFLKEYEKPSVVSANNVFAHCDNLQSFAQGVSLLLDEGDYFCFEFSYLLDIIQKDLIGAYFHEHLSHHSLSSLKPFLAAYDLHLVDALRTSSQGGSVIAIAVKSTNTPNISGNLKNLFLLETSVGLCGPSLSSMVLKSILRAQSDFRSSLRSLPPNTKVGVFGASRSLTTFDSVFNILDGVSAIYDDNHDKVGKYYPGSDIRVCSTENIFSDQPDALIIAAWVPTEKLISIIKSRFHVKYIIRLLSPITCLVIES